MKHRIAVVFESLLLLGVLSAGAQVLAHPDSTIWRTAAQYGGAVAALVCLYFLATAVRTNPGPGSWLKKKELKKRTLSVVTFVLGVAVLMAGIIA